MLGMNLTRLLVKPVAVFFLKLCHMVKKLLVDCLDILPHSAIALWISQLLHQEVIDALMCVLHRHVLYLSCASKGNIQDF